MNKEEQLKLNQLISKAWREGLWHSESKFSQSIKDFIDDLREKDKKDLLKKNLKFLEYLDRTIKDWIEVLKDL